MSTGHATVHSCVVLVQLTNVGRDRVVAANTRYELDGPGIETPSRWPCGQRRRSAAALLQALQVRILPGAWIFVLGFGGMRDMRREDIKVHR